MTLDLLACLVNISICTYFKILTILSPLQGFKFALVMGQQIAALKEANLALRAKLEEARIDLDRAEQNVTSLV